MIEYRAILKTSRKLERPVESVGMSLSGINGWIIATLQRYPDGEIVLFKSEEKVIGTFVGKNKVKNLAACQSCGHSSSAHLLTCFTTDKTHGSCAHIDCACRQYII